MKLREKDIWEERKFNLLLFTANGIVKKNGELVMGRGIALEVKNRFPFLPKLLGEAIKNSPNPKRYGLVIVSDSRLPFDIGAFQVKYHYKDKADLNLIKYSTQMLKKYASKHKNKRIIMNYPGIGYGWQKEEDILPIIKDLPGNVEIFKKDTSIRLKSEACS